TIFDHLLKEVDQISFFEWDSFAEWFARILLPGAMKMVTQSLCAGRGKLRDAGVFTVRFRRGNASMNPGYMTVLCHNLFGIVWRVQCPVLVAVQPAGIHAQH